MLEQHCIKNLFKAGQGAALNEKAKSNVQAASGSFVNLRCRRRCRRLLLLVPLQYFSFCEVSRASIPLTPSDLTVSTPPRQYQQAGNAERAYEVFLEAQNLVASGDYARAFDAYDRIVNNTSADSAIAQYARLGRAITRYELNEKARAIIELEYEVINLVGIPEAHAALSAACWAAGKTAIAETQWEIAMEFDKRFADVAWVRKNKHWGPELTRALESFLSLK